jgi:arylsulfatase A-like enzyme
MQDSTESSNEKGIEMNATSIKREWLAMRVGVLPVAALVLAFSAAMAWAQAPRSTVLPPPEEPFKGVIGRTYKESVMDKIPIIKAPEGAPNVLFVLIDDAGFGQASAFGGQIPTPTLDRLAQGGLRYTRYHTTALCSPTRAAILTGRNHHSAATGQITEFADSYPGYTSSIPRSTVLISEILRQNGYSTAAFGKWHNTPEWELTAAGPFDRWPTGFGFDKFYGFMGGETNQWNPPLFDGTTPVDMAVPAGKKGHYTLNDSLADKAIEWIHQQKSVTPDRPFFVYFATGATHAPHHVPPEWIGKFKGQFDQGWDRYREETFDRQKKLGVVPQDARLTPRPKEIPAYDSLTADQKKAAARLMEVFAAFTAQTDYEVGRLVAAIAEIGQLDNTLIFYEVGDNGASGEGSPLGTFNQTSGVDPSDLKKDNAYLVRHLDEVGGPKANNHIPVGWAWAMNTPFQWTKQIASHFGGTRNPIVVSWPRGIKDRGGVRSQFHHAIDIVPTILEAAGIPAPTVVNGVTQKPIEGISMMYSFADPKAASPRKTQYFEMLGNRALYDNGWVAAARHGRLPWEFFGSYTFDDDKWELYNVAEDFSEAVDLSAKYPQRLRELQDLFWVEAAKYNVLPLDDRFAERIDPKLRPSLIEGRTTFTYFGGASRIPEGSSPDVKNRSHTIAVDLQVPPGGAEGVLVAAGGPTGGYVLYVKDGRPVYHYNLGGFMYRWTNESSEKLPPGDSTVRFEFAYDGGGIGKGGTGRVYINGKKVGEGRIERTNFLRFSFEETFDTGRDTGLPVGDAYQSPFPFTGTIKKVTVDTAPAKLTEDDARTLVRGQRRLGAIGE